MKLNDKVYRTAEAAVMNGFNVLVIHAHSYCEDFFVFLHSCSSHWAYHCTVGLFLFNSKTSVHQFPLTVVTAVCVRACTL